MSTFGDDVPEEIKKCINVGHIVMKVTEDPNKPGIFQCLTCYKDQLEEKVKHEEVKLAISKMKGLLDALYVNIMDHPPGNGLDEMIGTKAFIRKTEFMHRGFSIYQAIKEFDDGFDTMPDKINVWLVILKNMKKYLGEFPTDAMEAHEKSKKRSHDDEDTEKDEETKIPKGEEETVKE